MDIRCPHCGEPWDMDSIHEEVDNRFPGKPWKRKGHDQEDYERNYYSVVRKDFRNRGCPALGGRCSGTKAHPAVGMVYDMMGDDIDGAAVFFEDHDLAYDDE